MLRTRGTPAEELGLATASDNAVVEAMIEHPILVERPIVAGPNGVKLCRPADAVQALL